MLIDTSGFFAVLDRSNRQNANAVALFDAASTLVTHNYVWAELVALCEARHLNRSQTLAFQADSLASPGIENVWVTATIHRAALWLLEHRPDKRYSLCDAVSFVIMRERGIVDALTTDHHFEQEGFVRLLKP